MYGQDLEFCVAVALYGLEFCVAVGVLAGLARLGLWVIDKMGDGK